MGKITTEVDDGDAIGQAIQLLEFTPEEKHVEAVRITVGEPDTAEVGSFKISLVGEDAVGKVISMLESTELDVGSETVEIAIGRETLAEEAENNSNKGIQEYTSHHVILHYISKISDRGDQVTTKKLIEEIDQYPKSTIRPAVWQLKQRGMIEAKGRVNLQAYTYELTQRGQRTLEKLGTPS